MNNSNLKWREKNREKYLAYKRDWARKKRLNNNDFRERENEKENKKYKENAEYRERKLKFFKKWKKENNKKFNELMGKSYKKNKQKWHSRAITLNIIKGIRGYKKTTIPINKFCKKCGNKKDLEIHHEIYPTTKSDIEKAIINNQIFFLCKKCHKSTKQNI